MPRKQITPYDLLKDLSQGLRQSSHIVGLDAYVPMDKQQVFHKDPCRGRIFSGGNRSGKTVAGIMEDVMWLTGNHPIWSQQFLPPIRGRIVGVDFDRGVDQILIPEIKKWIPTRFLIDGSWDKSYHKSSKVLTLTNGSTCEFMSYDQDWDKFAGTSRHFCHFDEEPPRNIFNECLARLIDTNGKWWLTLTPLEDFSWTADVLYEPIKDGQLQGKIALIETSTEENTHIKKEALDDLTSLFDEDEQIARKTGSGYAHTTLIYNELAHSDEHFSIDVLENKKVWEPIRKEWEHFQMFDHGLRNPTAFLFGAVGPEYILIYDEYYETDRLVGENAKGYLERLEELGVEQNLVGDPSTRNTDPITGTSIRIEYGEHGVWYQIGNNDVRAGLLRVKSVLKYKRLYVSTRCTNLLREARTYKWAKPVSSKTAARNNLMEQPVKRNDHAMDALRYGIMTLPKFQEEIDEERMEELAQIAGAVRAASDFDHVPSQEEAEKVFDEHLGLVS